MKKSPRILFFINGPLPSDLECAQAAVLGNNVAFRNAQLVGDEGAETCDGVVGCVPSQYKKFADGEKLMKKVESEQKKILKDAQDRIKGAEKAEKDK